MVNSSSPVIRPFLFLLCLILLVWSRPLSAQTNGTISGVVTDQAGASMPKVTVVARNTAGGSLRTAVTNHDGEYSFPALAPGDYTITFSAPGFATEVELTTLNITEHNGVDAKMRLSSASVTVTVTGQEPLLQTETATLGDVISGSSVEDLPLSTNNFTQLLALSPGVLAPINDASQLGRGTQNLNVNGARTNSNSIYVDGVDAVNVHVNGLSANSFGSNGVVIPPIDDVNQIKIQTALFDATTGRSGGSNTALLTKSGADTWHGSVYEYFRNTVFDANYYFLKAANQPRPELIQNQFGGNLGGPIIRDKAFFFVGYQGTRQRNGTQGQTSAIVPNLPQDRSVTSLGAYGATLGGTSHGGPAILANGSNISPVALAFLNLKFANGQYVFPSPNALIGTNHYFVASSASTFDEDLYVGSVDYQLGSRDHLKFSAIVAQQPQFYATSGSSMAQGFGVNQYFKSRLYEVEDIHIFSPAIVNEFHFGLSRLLGQTGEQNVVSLASIGMSRFNSNIFPDIPMITLDGSLSFGYSVNDDQADTDNTWQFFDNVTWLKGKHSMNFGFEMRRYQDNYFSNNRMRGTTSFSSIQNFLLGESGAAITAGGNGTGYSDVASISIASGIVQRYDRLRDIALFAGDSWKPLPRLTLLAGLRWEYLGLPTDIYGRDGAFRPNDYQAPPAGGVTSQGFVQAGNARNPLPAIAKVANTLTDTVGKLNFAPRLGMAYQLNNQMVLRGGWGVFYDRLSNQLGLLESLSLPNYVRTDSTNGSKSSTYNLTSSLANPFPALPQRNQFPILPQLYSPTAVNAPAAISINDVDAKITTPYYEQWGLQLQTAITPSIAFQLGYVGTQGHHLPVETQLNQAQIASPSNPINGTTTNNTGPNDGTLMRAPYLGFSNTGLLYLQTVINSNFNALQGTLVQRLGRAQFSMTYMWSKSMDTNSGSSDGSVFTDFSGDQTNIRQAYGVSDFDRTNHFAARLTEPVPVPPFRWARTATGSKVFKGISVALIAVAQSGRPVNISDGSGAAYYGTTESRANYAPGAVIRAIAKSGTTESRLGQYFNTSAFVASPNLFGTVARNSLRGPVSRDLDFSLTKTTKITKLVNMEFRAQAFNVTNTPNFSNPDGGVDDGSSFGTISGTSGNPRLLQFVLKLTF